LILITTQLGREEVVVHEGAVGLRDVCPPGVPQIIGLDVESTWMTGAGQFAEGFAVRTVQLAPDDHAAWVLRMDDLEQLAAARAVLDDPAKEFVSHTQMDPHAVLWLGSDVIDRFLDTYPLAVMAAPDDRAGQSDLKTISTRLGMPELAAADKELDDLFLERYRAEHPELGRRAVAAKTFQEHGFNTVPLDHPTFVKYAGLDAVAVRRAAPLLLGKLASIGTPGHLVVNERWLSAQVTRQKADGLLVDLGRLAALEDRAHGAVERATEDMLMLTGLKPTQNQKLVAWWGDEIAGGWPEDHPRTPSGAVSLGDGAHRRLKLYDMSEQGAAALEAYSRWQEVSNQHTLATQVRNGLDPFNRIHPTIYSVGTITSRMSSAGPNIQNWAKPKDLDDPNRAQRELLIPDPGEVFISCDFSQVEYRVAAALSGEPSLIETIIGGGDLHQLTADRIGISRQHAKTVNFAVLYGTGGAKLAKIMNYAITEVEGREIVHAYWDAYPLLKALNEEMKTRSGVRLFSGRWVPVGRITKGERAGQETVWALLNYLIQGNCRELLVGAWIAVKREFDAHPRWGARVRIPIHDELVASCKREYAEEVSAVMERCMTFDFMGVPIQAEADVLLDEQGVSRLMSGDIARKIKEAKAA
jgi:DNA polymerase I